MRVFDYYLSGEYLIRNLGIVISEKQKALAGRARNQNSQTIPKAQSGKAKPVLGSRIYSPSVSDRITSSQTGINPGAWSAQ